MPAKPKPQPKPRPRPATVDDYVASLPEPRREAIQALREAVNRHLPEGYPVLFFVYKRCTG